MALSTPTGLLILAVLVGQAAGFAKVPKDAAESGDLRASRTFSTGGSICAGPDISEWKDTYGDGCDWYAEHDPGCNFEPDYGQDTNCPVTCSPGCVQSFLCGAGTVWQDGKCIADPDSVCGAGTKMGKNGKCEPNGSVCGYFTYFENGKCEVDYGKLPAYGYYGYDEHDYSHFGY